MDVTYCGLWVILMAVVICPAVVEGAWVRVNHHGALPDDGEDDTEALQKAVGQCAAQEGSVLAFEKGRYDFQAGRNAKHKGTSLHFAGCRRLTLEGNGATLMFDGVTRAAVLHGCEEVLIRNLTIDWKRPPFSVGKVLSTCDGGFEVEVLEEFPVEGGEPVEAFMEYDPETGRPLRRGVDSYHNVESTELVRPQVLRVNLKRPVSLRVGRLVVLRHQVYSYNAFSISECRNVRFQNVTVYCAPGMGLAAQRSEDIELERFNVVIKPRTRRLMSTTADATHFNGCRGSVTIRNCVFEGMGDDAVNVHGMYHMVAERVDERTLVTRCRNQWIVEPVVGDRMEFTDFRTLLPYSVGIVKQVEVDRQEKVHRIAFEEALPKQLRIGDVLGNVAWAPRLRISRCAVRSNRARGFLIQTRDAIVENNTFQHVSGAAVHITCDADYWTESIGTRSVVFRNNRIEDCNFGAAMGPGAVRVFADIKGGRHAAPGAHRDITIDGNVIDGTDNAAVFVGSTEGVVIRDNRISDCCRKPTGAEGRAAIFLVNSRDAEIVGNVIDRKKRGQGFEKAIGIGPGCDGTTIRVERNKGGD